MPASPAECERIRWETNIHRQDAEAAKMTET